LLLTAVARAADRQRSGDLPLQNGVVDLTEKRRDQRARRSVVRRAPDDNAANRRVGEFFVQFRVLVAPFNRRVAEETFGREKVVVGEANEFDVDFIRRDRFRRVERVFERFGGRFVAARAAVDSDNLDFTGGRVLSDGGRSGDETERGGRNGGGSGGEELTASGLALHNGILCR